MTEIVSPQSSQNIEMEIASLNQEIAKRREALEAMNGVTSADQERAVVREVLGEKLNEANIPVGGNSDNDDEVNDGDEGETADEATAGAALATPPGSSYLTSLSDEDFAKVKELVAVIFAKGLKAGLAEAQKFTADNPFLLDAFHDALTDEVYNTLVEQNKLTPNR